MKRSLCILAALMLMLTFCVQSFAAENSFPELQNGGYVESVNISLPNIDVYVSGQLPDKTDAKATFDGEALAFNGAEAYDPSKVSSCVYVLADISGSITTEMYSEMTSAVKSLISEKTDKQTVKFYTFSQSAVEILSGEETYDEAAAKLDAVKVTGNGYTALYDALYLVHGTAAAEKSKYQRQFVVIFTDGANEDNKAKRTADETKALYKALDLPIYAMCMNTASASSKQVLGEIARISGGTNRVYPATDAQTEFKALMETANSVTQLHFVKKNNKAGDKNRNLSVSINGKALPAVTVYDSAVSIKDDNAAPTFTVMYSAENRCLEIAFSKSVVNADNVGAYIITDSKGKAVPVESVSYDEASKTARLYFSGRFYSGKYTVSLSGITDDSFAANKPAGDITADIVADSSALKILDYWWAFLIPFAIAIIVLLVLLVVKRKRNINNVKEFFEVENENNYEVKHHIVNASGGRPVFLEISTGNVSNQIKTHISSSLIFGRSDVCDICIDDVKLSRQHFALEQNADGSLVLTDLGSTNGTFLNGGKIAARGKLVIKSGDMISAGLTKIRVQF